MKYLNVKKLYGEYDLIAEFESECINIIYGYNGCGKSTLLKIIRYIFNGEFNKLVTMEFQEIVIGLKDKQKIRVSYKKEDGIFTFFVNVEFDTQKRSKVVCISYNIIKNEFNYEYNGKLHRSNREYLRAIRKEIKEFFNESFNKEVYLLDISRLHKKKYKEVKSMNGNKSRYISIPSLTIIENSKEIVTLLKKNDLKERVELFESVINQEFKLKDKSIKIEFDGIKLYRNNGKTFRLEHLSTGEQHIIIIFYYLIFRLKENETVMIDEPELALHLMWQNRLLEAIEKIAKNMNAQVIIATHSPDVIGNYFTDTFELKEGNNDE